MNVFVVNTPLQLINAIEAKKYFDLKDDESLLIVVYLKNRKEQLVKVVGSHSWAEVKWIESEEDVFQQKKNLLLKIKEWIKECIRFKKEVNCISNKYKKINRMFLGNYLMESQLHIANKFDPNFYYLLDDGNAVLTVQALRRDEVSFINIRKGFFSRCKSLLKKYVFYFDFKKIESVTYFTTYEVACSGRDRSILNEFNYFKKSQSNKVFEDRVVFIGAPLVELGIIKYCDFVSQMERVFDYFEGKEITYVKHPSENSSQVEDFLCKKEINTIENNLPLEIAFIEESTLPSIVSSYYSSALLNLNRIFSDKITFFSFKINSSLISNDFKLNVNSCYYYYESIRSDNFKVVDDY